jgi:hypothetical protein
MDKTLSEIEREYTTEIVKFFTREYSTISRKRKKEEIISLISRQIENRLLNTGLIRNYRVDAILYPKDERRDVVIDNLLENKDDDVTNKVTVLIEHIDRTFLCYEHLID